MRCYVQHYALCGWGAWVGADAGGGLASLSIELGLLLVERPDGNVVGHPPDLLGVGDVPRTQAVQHHVQCRVWVVVHEGGGGRRQGQGLLEPNLGHWPSLFCKQKQKAWEIGWKCRGQIVATVDKHNRA